MWQSSMLRALVVFLLALSACTHPRPVRDRAPIPVGNLLALSPVEALGYEIYLRDQAAWRATDVALQAGLEETPSEGWITLLRPEGWLVRFLGPCSAGVCSHLDVEQYDPDEPLLVRAHDAEPVSEVEAARWRARQLAANTEFRRCTPRYNTVVVEFEEAGSPVWRVYLLASSDHPRDVVLTGHHRITTTIDGSSILREEPLSKGCVVQQPPENVAGLIVTHSLHPEPIETHVFTSLDYRMPLYVGAPAGKFRVNGAKIENLDEL